MSSDLVCSLRRHVQEFSITEPNGTVSSTCSCGRLTQGPLLTPVPQGFWGWWWMTNPVGLMLTVVSLAVSAVALLLSLWVFLRS